MMLGKLVKAFSLLSKDVKAVKNEVAELRNSDPTVIEGKPGKDGVSPDVNGIITAVLERIPTPKDGTSPDPKAIVANVLEVMPKPRDGRDAPIVNVSDVASIVLAKIPKPKDGDNGPSLETVVSRVRAQINDGKPGLPGRAGKDGKPGRDGVSITDVLLSNNDLFVFLNGKKKKAGTINIPTPTAPFNPGNVGGGGSARETVPDHANNVEIINKLADFPKQDSTTITCEANTQYFIGKLITTDKRFIMESGSSIVSINPFFPAIFYTGTGSMFNGDGTTWSMSNMFIDCANGTLFNQINAGVVLAQNFQCLSCVDVGSFAGLAGPVCSFVLDNAAIISISGQGLKILGFMNVLSLIRFFQRSSNGTHKGIDLGTAVINNLEFSNLDFDGPVGSFGISGLTDSGNIEVNRIATVSDSNLEGSGMVPTDGVSKDDIRWSFRDNGVVPDSRSQADIFLTGGAEIITIVDQGVFVEIGVPSTGGVSWDSEISSRFTVGADGTITYISERAACLQLIGTATVEKVGGGSDEIEVRFAKNWLPGQTGIQKSRAVTQNITATSVPLSALVDANKGDNFRVIFANNGGTPNIIAEVTSFTVRE